MCTGWLSDNGFVLHKSSHRGLSLMCLNMLQFVTVREFAIFFIVSSLVTQSNSNLSSICLDPLSSPNVFVSKKARDEI